MLVRGLGWHWLDGTTQIMLVNVAKTFLDGAASLLCRCVETAQKEKAYDEAEALYNKALRLEPNNTFALRNLAGFLCVTAASPCTQKSDIHASDAVSPSWLPRDMLLPDLSLPQCRPRIRTFLG